MRGAVLRSVLRVGLASDDEQPPPRRNWHAAAGGGCQYQLSTLHFAAKYAVQALASACTDCRSMPFPLTYRRCQEQSYSLDNRSIPVYLCNHIDFLQKFITDSVPAAEDWL